MSGWIPYNDDPFQSGPARSPAQDTLDRGEGIEFAAGFLTISSASKTSLLGAAGLTLIFSESSPAVGSMPPGHRYSYQVDDPRKLGEITWESPAPRVSVAIESQLTVYPDSAEWVAVLRYDVSGGCTGCHPLENAGIWADGAEIDFAGDECRLSKELLGTSAFWTITPKHPILGSERFVLRSTMPLPSNTEMVHPELAPLGWGAGRCLCGRRECDRAVALDREIDGPPSIPYADQVSVERLCSGRGNADWRRYRVMSQDWLLQVQSWLATAPSSTQRSNRAWPWRTF